VVKQLRLSLYLTLAVADAALAGLSAESLFQVQGIWSVSVSPSGNWALAHAVRGGIHGLLVQKVGSLQVIPVFVADEPLAGVSWVGADSIAIHLQASGQRTVLAGWLRETDGDVALDWHRIPAPGWFVDAVPRLDGSLIWEFEYGGYNSVHRIELEELVQYHERDRTRARSIEIGETLARVKGSARNWIIDRDGHPRAYTTYDEGTYTIFARTGNSGSFRKVYSYAESDEAAAVVPLALHETGTKLVVRAYKGNDTVGLYEFDVATGEIGSKVYDRPDVDITHGMFDPIHGELIAAIYEEGGERRFHYLDSYASEQLEELRGQFPKEELAIVSRSADRSFCALAVSSSTNPGTYFLRDEPTGQVIEVGRVASDLDEREHVEVETLEVESADGTRIEAFLAQPRSPSGPDGAPLVVHPHGGPIGVRDSKDYNPFVQYLASWGFATLQVNYRGSSGYGRSFEEAGRKEWAQGIEDDIDAAVEAVMARPEIDETRICIVGGSYGGFSALASIVRHQTRYRCAASVNGVTDIPLMFESSDFADDERILELFAENVGDLENEQDKLIDISPVYQVERMQAPVYVVYGTEDRRVDPDHSHRLLLMLETLGKEHESLELEGAEHSFSTREWIIFSRAVRRYLTRYLFPGEEFVPDPGVDAHDIYELPTLDR
jgi:dienelactone hydrolase